MKKIKAAAEITQVSVDKIGGEEQGANARASPEGDGTGTAARRSEKVCWLQTTASNLHGLCSVETALQSFVLLLLSITC